MKNLARLLILISIFSIKSEAQEFTKFFEDAVMRIDYIHMGNSVNEEICIDRIFRYEGWSRNNKNLIDPFNNGRYYIRVYSVTAGELIFSKGFDSYFGEYQTSGPAIGGIRKAYHETAVIPFPKDKIKFVVEKRNRMNRFDVVFSQEIDPREPNIIFETLNDPAVRIVKAFTGGDPASRVDIAILAEGFTLSEYDKFVDDVEKFKGYFFEQEPYKSLKQSFNIYGVFKPSVESGTDEPRAGFFRNTILNTTFNSLGSERYLLTEDNKAIQDLAAYVPYDAIYVMVNHKRYGGGGIYNSFCTFTADAQFSKYLFLHEFGHSFGGLADEYYTSSTAYNDFYPAGIEPNEANITALRDKEYLKWADLLTPGIEIPTPWEKADYDKMDIEWQVQRAELNNNITRLKKEKADPQIIAMAEADYSMKDKAHSENVDQFLAGSKFTGQVGAFEGAGYVSTGLYRPMLDCIMFTKGDKPFCKVCEAHLIKVISFYAE